MTCKKVNSMEVTDELVERDPTRLVTLPPSKESSPDCSHPGSRWTCARLSTPFKRQIIFSPIDQLFHISSNSYLVLGDQAGSTHINSLALVDIINKDIFFQYSSVLCSGHILIMSKLNFSKEDLTLMEYWKVKLTVLSPEEDAHVGELSQLGLIRTKACHTDKIFVMCLAVYKNKWEK